MSDQIDLSEYEVGVYYDGAPWLQHAGCSDWRVDMTLALSLANYVAEAKRHHAEVHGEAGPS